MTKTQIKNWALLLLGKTLINKHGWTVSWEWSTMSQKITNPKRKSRPYSLDDKSWRVFE